MRCSANGASLRHKATFFALKTVPLRVTYTSSPPAGGASPQGEAKVRVVPHGQLTNGFCPNTATFSAVHNISVSYRSRLARSPGGLGGREPVAAQPPERSFFFLVFLSAEKEKRIGDNAVVKSLSENKTRQTMSCLRRAKKAALFSQIIRNNPKGHI